MTRHYHTQARRAALRSTPAGRIPAIVVLLGLASSAGGIFAADDIGWDSVREILQQTRKSLQNPSVQVATEALELLGEASRLLSEVILFKPGAPAPQGEDGGPATEEGGE